MATRHNGYVVPPLPEVVYASEYQLLKITSMEITVALRSSLHVSHRLLVGYCENGILN